MRGRLKRTQHCAHAANTCTFFVIFFYYAVCDRSIKNFVESAVRFVIACAPIKFCMPSEQQEKIRSQKQTTNEEKLNEGFHEVDFDIGLGRAVCG